MVNGIWNKLIFDIHKRYINIIYTKNSTLPIQGTYLRQSAYCLFTITFILTLSYLIVHIKICIRFRLDVALNNSIESWNQNQDIEDY